MSKRINAVFGSGVFSKTLNVFQWDSDDRLVFAGINLPETYEVHFANSLTGEAKKAFGTSEGVTIPPEYFIPGTEIYAWLWVVTNDGGYTKYQVKIPVHKRAQPSDITPTPAQQDALDQAIAAINEATESVPSQINAALLAAKESGEFDGPQGEIGPAGPGADLSAYRTAADQDVIDAAQNTAISGKYTKPSTGIPATDLAPDVQTSLGKADTALQSETDPTVPAWAKAANKPTYTASEVGALPASTAIPEKVSDLTNDSGFVNASGAAAAAPVQSVNGKTGAVTLTASDVGAGNYSKPSGGIPKTDLANDVQTSLGKADTALQEHQSLAAYRTAADQDVIDAAQNNAISGKLSTTGDAYRAASIPMGELDSTSTATVMTATVPGITELRDGVCMWLKNGVITSASGFTVNINGLGAKPCYSSLAAASRSTTIFNVNYTMLFVYNSTRVDGGCWDIVYGVDTNTTYTPPKLGFGYGTCTTAAATVAKTASISSYTLVAGGIVAIKFAEDVPAGATLNISSKGAKAIYYKGAAITAGVIKAGDTVTMIYSTYYHVLSIDRDVDTLPPSPSDDDPLMDSGASPGSSTDYARADHVHPSDSSKIGYEDPSETVTMTASGSTVTCFKSFAQIYLLFSTQKKTYFALAASQTDFKLFNLDRVDGANQTIYLSSIVGGILSQIVLTPGGSSTMTGTLSTIDLNLQSAQGVSF